MSDVKWIKIVTDIFDDEKMLLIESIPSMADSVIVIWFKLLCMAGKSNNSGVFMLNDKIAYTDEMLAQVFRRDEKIVQVALRTFEKFGMIEIINNVITIPNWSKHQSLDQLEERKEYMREYMQKYREKQRKLTDSKQCKVNSKVNVNSLEEDKEVEENKELDIKNKYMCDFEELWNVYPRKKEKAKAYKCYQARLNDGYSNQDILIATKAYAAECKKNKTEEKYIKLAATFLGPNTPFVDYIAKEVIESGNSGNKGNESDPFDIVALVQRGKQDLSDL